MATHNTSTKQRTRVIARVDSHISGIVDISKSLVFVQTAKSTKARGRATLHLVPHTNYLNKIFPNDVINIYIDPGDGKRGFVRTFMGYVDRIGRQTTTDDNGKTSTRFVLQCSDFQKAIDKTHIYFNSYMRTILDEKFARSADGAIRPSFTNDADGSALRNAGLTAFGSPADYVENFLQVLLGFGGQWKLPESYPKNNTQIQQNRNYRIQRAKARLLPLIRNTLIQAIGAVPQAIDAAVQQTILSTILTADKSEAERVIARGNQSVQAAKTLAASSVLDTLRFQQLVADASFPVGIQDLISLDFIENLATDGFNLNAAVWQAQGTLAQFLYGNTNDFVNELIFDLRPVSAGDGEADGGLQEGGYSTKADDIGINRGGTKAMPSPVNAVQYVPAVVFREYPYSVIENYDVSGIAFISGETAEEVIGAARFNVTPKAEINVLFGPVFAKGINESGRHIYKYPEPIASVECGLSAFMQPLKHIDSITINTTDVKDSDVGRSDEDVINLFQLTPHDAQIQAQYRSILSNFSPLVNQASVARDGLRVWEHTTQFANFGDGSQCRVGGAPDTDAVRRNLARWQLLIDHWYQHNSEYLSGSIVLRAMPELRVGYRLDWEDRNESYYVEEVRHEWHYPNAMRTTVAVVRGQRNDPFPVYIPPVFLDAQNKTVVQYSGDRSFTGRLAKFFEIRDNQASRHALGNPGPVSSAGNTVDEKDNIPRSGTVVFPGTNQVRRPPDFGADLSDVETRTPFPTTPKIGDEE